MQILQLFPKQSIYLIKISLIIFSLTACSESDSDPGKTFAGDIISSELRQAYSVSQIRQVLNSLQIPDSFTASFSVESISIIYQTSDAYGNEIQASGALLIPQDMNNIPMMSLQHGTETKEDLVASVHPQNSVEGIIGILTSSMGYITCIPDYPGFGASNTYHPYMHAASLSKSSIDFLIAAKTYCSSHNISFNDELYLAGYSEGGFATLALQKEIEENYSDQFNITAVAPMAGPYDLSGLIEYMFQRQTYPWPAYIAYFFYAYNNIYRWNKIDLIFNEPYNTIIPSFFDGSHTFFEINNQLPDSISLLLKNEFITNYLSGDEQEIFTALAENTLLGWVPIAPIHFFHGDADEVSPYQNALTAMQAFTENGATNIRLTTISGGTHDTSSLPSVLGAVSWFEGFRNYNM